MRSDVDPDVFLSEIFQLRDELDDLGETVNDERLTTIILDALPEEMYSAVKMQLVKEPDLGLEEIIGMMKRIFTNHSESRQFSKIKSRTETFGVAVVSQEHITCVSPL